MMQACPRPECDGTLFVEQIGGSTETTCRACGRQPSSPPVELSPSRTFEYKPPWADGKRRGRKPRQAGKRKMRRAAV